MKHDTLFVQLKPTKGKLQRDAMTDDWRNPELIIQMPALMAVTTTNANCRIAAFTGDALTLQQLGKEGNLSLNKLQYKQLTISLSGNNRLKISELVNQIGQASITVRDSAQLDQLTNFANGFTLRADSTTMLRLTGKTLRQMREK